MPEHPADVMCQTIREAIFKAVREDDVSKEQAYDEAISTVDNAIDDVGNSKVAA